MTETFLPYSLNKILESPPDEVSNNVIIFLETAIQNKKLARILNQIDKKLGDTPEYPNFECWLHLFECLFKHDLVLTQDRDKSIFDYIDQYYNKLESFVKNCQLPNIRLNEYLLTAIMLPIWGIDINIETIEKIHIKVLSVRQIKFGIPDLDCLHYHIKDRVIDALYDIDGISNENIFQFENTGDLSFLDHYHEIPILLTRYDISQIQMLEAAYEVQLEVQEKKQNKKWSDADLIMWKAMTDSGTHPDEIAEIFAKAKDIKVDSAKKGLNRQLKQSNSRVFIDLKPFSPKV